MSTQVFVPTIPTIFLLPSGHDVRVVDLINAIWGKMEMSLEAQGVDKTQLSIHSLSTLVPLEPWDSIRDRVEDSAHKNGSAVKSYYDKVPSDWCDPENVRVYLYIDQISDVRAAEKLYKALWGKELNVILQEISDGGTTWKYVSKEQIDSLELVELGYREQHGLLVRPEYDDALGTKTFDYSAVEKVGCSGVIVTGQQGIGKSCFLYYLLFRLLSQMTPVAFQLSRHFLVFGDDGVRRHPLDAGHHHLPAGTWALSDSNEETTLPCSAFLGAARRRRAWIIQATSPPEERWKKWKQQGGPFMFVMKNFSIEEMTALGKILGLDAADLRRNYEKWGPSARTCVRLSRVPTDEKAHEGSVKKAAIRFVRELNPFEEIDAIWVSHVLFSVRPSDETAAGRTILVADMATERIKAIISYAAAAAADAYRRGAFYRNLNNHQWFKASAGYMFEKFVLTWLSSDQKAGSLVCTSATGRPNLVIPACGEKQTAYFDNLDALRRTKVDKLPFCLLPRFPSLFTADAIVCTDRFIITVQVTVSGKHGAKERGLADIRNSLPSRISRGREWCHVLITDEDEKAQSLRGQRLSNLPNDIYVYSGVCDVSQLGGRISKRLADLDEDNQRILNLENRYDIMDVDDEVETDHKASGDS